MDQIVSGAFGSAAFGGRIDANGATSAANTFSINTGDAVNIFRRISVLQSNILENSMGMFTKGVFGRNKELKFASLGSSSHLLRPASKQLCKWKSKGKIDMISDVIEIEAFEAQMEQCPDTFINTCFEKIYGTGMDVYDFMATAEGQKLMNEIIRIVYERLGNSFWNVVYYAQHPLIEQAQINGTYGTNDPDWDDYYEQQMTRKVGGIMTIIDQLKLDGLDQYNVEILPSDISQDYKSYIGDPTELFDRVLDAQSDEMCAAADATNNVTGELNMAVLEVSDSIFKAYRKHLVDHYGSAGVPEAMYYMMNGTFTTALGLPTNSIRQQGVLRYNGHLVVRKKSWNKFDKITGTITHRCIAAIPGVYGIGYDVPSLRQFGGLGLRMIQKLEAPYNGMIYMNTRFDLGMGILDKRLVVNASRTYIPNAL